MFFAASIFLISLFVITMLSKPVKSCCSNKENVDVMDSAYGKLILDGVTVLQIERCRKCNSEHAYIIYKSEKEQIEINYAKNLFEMIKKK